MQLKVSVHANLRSNFNSLWNMPSFEILNHLYLTIVMIHVQQNSQEFIPVECVPPTC